MQELDKLINNIIAEQNAKLIKQMDTLAAIIYEAVMKNFNENGRTGGSTDFLGGGKGKWKPLSKSYLKRLTKKGDPLLIPTLERTGKLKKGIRVEPIGTSIKITVDPRVNYASANNDLRPFLQITDEDVQEIRDYLLKFL